MSRTQQGSSRRHFMKMVVASPLLAQIAAQNLYAKSAAAVGVATKENVYTRLGLKTIINCRGTWTYLSGSLPLPQVRTAMEEASHHFVNMVELQQAVGRKLASLTGAESGLVTSGAAGAMAAATAACIAGSDPAKIWQLPDVTGLKHEVIMSGGRSAFDSAIRLTGAKLVLVDTPDEIANAVNDKTAMIYTTNLGDRLAQDLAVAKSHNVPMLLDDAAGIPPADNLTHYAKMKIDLYTFSGGKGLQGPQCSGVLLGRKDLIDAALRNCAPWEGAVCRPMKVGKEEVIGALTAVETWLKIDQKKLYAEWNARVDRIGKLVATVPGAQSFLGSASLGLHARRLRHRAPPKRPVHRSPRPRQSQPRRSRPRRHRQAHRQGTQSSRPHRAHLHDHPTRRRNHRRQSPPRHPRRRP
jgi:seryl-tRNA(Sec) selenium transferase